MLTNIINEKIKIIFFIIFVIIIVSIAIQTMKPDQSVAISGFESINIMNSSASNEYLSYMGITIKTGKESWQLTLSHLGAVVVLNMVVVGVKDNNGYFQSSLVGRELFQRSVSDNIANKLVDMYCDDNLFFNVQVFKSNVIGSVYTFLFGYPGRNLDELTVAKSDNMLLLWREDVLDKFKLTIPILFYQKNSFEKSTYLVVSINPNGKTPILKKNISVGEKEILINKKFPFPLEEVYIFAYSDMDDSGSYSQGDLVWESKGVIPLDSKVSIDFNEAKIVSGDISAKDVQGLWRYGEEEFFIVNNSVLYVECYAEQPQQTKSFEIVDYNSKRKYIVLKHLLSFNDENQLSLEDLEVYYQKVSWESSVYDSNIKLFKFYKRKDSLKQAKRAFTFEKKKFKKTF